MCSKTIIFVLFCFVVVNATMSNIHEKWTLFKDKYGKHYDIEEDQKRFDIFQNNVMLIKRLSSTSTHKLSVNKFADLTSDEISKFKKVQDIHHLTLSTNHS